tara:strand:- start:44 stop:1117 length:1074 start_codon:yes stop_codon:yes gene_type:complete
MNSKNKTITIRDFVYNTKYRIDTYQRRKAWNNNKQVEFIKRTLEYGILDFMHFDTRNHLIINIIDAQQRWNALKDYINDRFEVNKKVFSRLSIAEQNAFLDLKIVTREWYDGTQEEVRKLYELLNSGQPLKAHEIRKARNGYFATDIVTKEVEHLQIFANHLPKDYNPKKDIKFLYTDNHRDEFRNTYEKMVFNTSWEEGLYHVHIPNKNNLLKQTTNYKDASLNDAVFQNTRKIAEYLADGMEKFRAKNTAKTFKSKYMFRDVTLLLLHRVVFDLHNKYNMEGLEETVVTQALRWLQDAKAEELNYKNGDKQLSDYAKAMGRADSRIDRKSSYDFLYSRLEAIVKQKELLMETVIA